MATMEQLKESARALAAELEIAEPTMDDLNHADLTSLVRSLDVENKAQLAAAEEAGKVETLNAEAVELSEFLGAEPPAEGLDSAALAALVESLRAGVVEKDKADANAQGMKDAKQSSADAAAGAQRKKAEDAEDVPVYEYCVMPGKSLVCRRGILDGGDEVKESDCGDAAGLTALISKGIVGKGSQGE